MIHLVSAADEAFIPGLCVTLASTLFSLPPAEEVTFHILSGHLAPSSIAYLEKIARFHHPHCKLLFHQINHADFKNWKPGPNNSMMTYARLLLGSLLPSISKVLYLDSDIIVLSNIMELWEMPMHGKIILAARGGAHAMLPSDCPWELTPAEQQLPYINAGIMLLDLDQWRTRSIEEEVQKALSSKRNFVRHDQTILNYLLRYDIGLFSMDWNWQGRIFSEQEASSIKIIHFITSKKPWRWWNGDPRFQLWRSFYKKQLGSPLQLFFKQKAWDGFFYGVFESLMLHCPLLRRLYTSLLKCFLALKKNSSEAASLLVIYEYYTTGLGGERGVKELQQTRSVLSTLLRRF